MSEELADDSRPRAKVTVDYTPGDRLRMMLIDWPEWLIGPLAAAFAMLFVSFLFRLFRGDTVAGAVSDLPFGIAVILGLSFLAIRIGFDIVPLVAGHFRGEARNADEAATFGMDEDGLSIDSKRMRATLGWAMIASVRATPDRLYFFLSRRSALMMPRRCFASGEDFKRWIAYSEQRLSDSKGAE